MTSLIRTYAMIILLMNVSFGIVNATGLFPMSESLSGLEQTNAELMSTKAELDAAYKNGASITDYLSVSAYIIFYGVKILLVYLETIFTGLSPVMQKLHIPAIIANPLIIAIDALVLYDIGSKLRG